MYRIKAPAETSESEIPEVKPSETTTKTVTNDMLDYLTTQLQSNHYADWNAVATCDYATEEHLLTAEKNVLQFPRKLGQQQLQQTYVPIQLLLVMLLKNYPIQLGMKFGT